MFQSNLIALNLSSNIAVTRSHKFLAAKNSNFVNVTQVVPNVSLATQLDSFFRSLKFYIFLLQKKAWHFCTLSIFYVNGFWLLSKFSFFLGKKKLFSLFFANSSFPRQSAPVEIYIFCFSFCFVLIMFSYYYFSFSLHFCYCFWMIVAQLRTR